MSEWKSKRPKVLFKPEGTEPFKISRSKIDLFMDCPRCFYMDRRLGIGRPPGFPFNLNSAVDTLLKKEFDIHRAKGTRHPLVKQYGIYAVPFEHERMEEWRDALRRGIQFHHEDTHFIITGGIDDVWVDPEGKLNIVDYKATSKTSEVNIDADWQISYKRQVEVYQWLFRKNEFQVSNTAYFVYCNGKTDREAFDARLEFDIKIIPYEGNDEWIEPTLHKIRECLVGNLPPATPDCEYCEYVARSQEIFAS
ncbi:MAG TPA: PD-(D/E)XK nuclease family protein [Candidatus Paceibacterota bacterium]